MGKWANERRKMLFDKLKETGQLEKPIYVRKPKVRKPKEKVARAPKQEKPSVNCCMIKYDDLPNGFRKCHGCPLDTSPAT